MEFGYIDLLFYILMFIVMQFILKKESIKIGRGKSDKRI
jgi:hypothetical protein